LRIGQISTDFLYLFSQAPLERGFYRMMPDFPGFFQKKSGKIQHHPVKSAFQ